MAGFLRPGTAQILRGGYCPEAQQFFARATNLTGSSKARYNQTIRALVMKGYWARMDLLQIWATDNQATALLNLKNSSFASTTSGTVSFSIHRGFTGNGSNFYLNSNFTPSGDGVNYLQDSKSMSVGILTNRVTNNTYRACSANNAAGTGYDHIIPKWSDGAAYGALSTNTTNANAASSTAKGIWIACRTSSSQIDLYRNADTAAFATNAASTSEGNPDRSALFFAGYINAGGGISNWTADEMAFGFLGAGFSAAEQSEIAQIINDLYLRPLNINIF